MKTRLPVPAKMAITNTPAGTPLTASLSHDRPCLVSTSCASVGPIKPPPYSRPVSRPFGMFARTFPLILPPPLLSSLPCSGQARRATSQEPSQVGAWNRSALSEDTVRDRNLRQLRLVSSRIQGSTRRPRTESTLTAAWRLGARPLCSATLAVIIQERSLKHAPPSHWFGASLHCLPRCTSLRS